ncbi:MAG: AAA family ATPase [Planctomycetaceae bacterium]
MIDRLLSLELQNFRGYRDVVSVPLDADIVLIHGSNGSGKSSLLQALELAVTGDVSDLSRFEDSYPRCLQNLAAKSPPRVTLRYRSDSQTEVTHTISKPGVITGQSLTKKEIAFFRDRCYLSQARLSRLLELYQAVDKDHPEAQLVTFIRELLGLDYLEHLTAGLEEIGLITRVRKNLPALQQLEDAQARSEQDIRRLRENIQTRAATLAEEIAECRTLALEDCGDPLPQAPWTVAGIQQRLDTLRSSSSSQTAIAQREQLQQDQARLAMIAEFVNGCSAPGGVSLTELKSREAAARLNLQALETRLVAEGQAVRQVLQELDVVTNELTTSSGLEVWLEQLDALVARELARQQESLAEADARSRELELLSEQLDSTAAELQALAPSASSHDDDSTLALIAALKTVLNHVHDDQCPVCGRDYSELNLGELRSRLDAEIRHREALAGADSVALQQRAELERRVADVTRQLDHLRSVAAPYLAKGDAARINLARLQPLVEQLLRTRPDRELWQQTLTEISLIDAQLRNLEVAQEQQSKYRLQLEELADRWKLPEIPTELIALAQKLSELLQAKLTASQQQATLNQRLQTALDRVVRLAFEQEHESQALNRATASQALRNQARQRVDERIQTARELRKDVLTVKGEILNQVFNGTLNRLWRELFDRLVKVEPFRPWLSEPESVRGRLYARIQGVAGNAPPFADLAAVLSCGNLNTAALSLFLALHLIEQPKHRVLVFDDPVQNMDDVKAIQFAGLLRAIVLQANRQLVIAVHERQLFEYLCLELGPTRPEESLISIDLSRDPQNLSARIQHTRHIWKPDRIQFTER